MTGSARERDRSFSAPDFFDRATERLSLDPPRGLAEPRFIPRLGAGDANPAIVVAMEASRPIRTAAVLVPIIVRAEPTVLFTDRTAGLGDHPGQISFPGGKIEAADKSPAAAALREAEEEIGLDRRFVEPIGYLDIHAVPSGFRIVPVVARVREGFSLHLNPGEVEGAFEAPLAFLMAPENLGCEPADWNGVMTSVYAIQFNGRRIWGVTAGILQNMWERLFNSRMPSRP
jgi:8-oxo-dGTP pyrophosphatase MutT (NUDIX family)